MSVSITLDELDGAALELARDGEEASRSRDVDTAIQLFWHAIDAHARETGRVPHSVVRRLASVYRRARRHDEEVALLLRFQERDESGSPDRRYAARLTKAMTLAERGRRSESGALLYVRQILSGERPMSSRRRNKKPKA